MRARRVSSKRERCTLLSSWQRAGGACSAVPARPGSSGRQPTSRRRAPAAAATRRQPAATRLHDLDLGLAHHVHGLGVVDVAPASRSGGGGELGGCGDAGAQASRPGRSSAGAETARRSRGAGRLQPLPGGLHARAACSLLTGRRCPGGRGRAAGTGCSSARLRRRRRQSRARRRRCWRQPPSAAWRPVQRALASQTLCGGSQG